MPAPASSGPMSMKALSVSRIPRMTIVTRPTLRSSWEMVWPRCSRSLKVVSSPSSTARSIRREMSVTARMPR